MRGFPKPLSRWLSPAWGDRRLAESHCQAEDCYDQRPSGMNMPTQNFHFSRLKSIS
jgi:hypothetical protein